MIFYVHKFYSDYSVKVKTQNMSKIRSTGYTKIDIFITFLLNVMQCQFGFKLFYKLNISYICTLYIAKYDLISTQNKEETTFINKQKICNMAIMGVNVSIEKFLLFISIKLSKLLVSNVPRWGILALKGLYYSKVHSNTAPWFRASCVINTPLWQLYDPIPRSLTLHVSSYFYKSLSDSI